MAAIKVRNVNRVWQTGIYKVGSPNYVNVSGVGADPAAGFTTFDTQRVEDAGTDTWANGDYVGILVKSDDLKYKIWTASWDGTSDPHRLLVVDEEYTIGNWGDGDAVQVIATPTSLTLKEQIARPTFAAPVEITTATTALQSWNGHIVEGSASSPFAITLPTGLTNMHFMLVQTGTGVVSVTPDTNVTLNGDTSTIGLAAQYKSAYLYTKGSNVWVMVA